MRKNGHVLEEPRRALAYLSYKGMCRFEGMFSLGSGIEIRQFGLEWGVTYRESA